MDGTIKVSETLPARRPITKPGSMEAQSLYPEPVATDPHVTGLPDVCISVFPRKPSSHRRSGGLPIHKACLVGDKERDNIGNLGTPWRFPSAGMRSSDAPSALSLGLI